MSKAHHIQVRISVTIDNIGYGDCKYAETFGLPVHGSMDSVEALALLVVEIEHFKQTAWKSLKTGIIEDAVPEGAGYPGGVPAGESPD